MIDTSEARNLLDNLRDHSSPSSGCGSDPCTVADLKRVIQATSNVPEALISAVENEN